LNVVDEKITAREIVQFPIDELDTFGNTVKVIEKN